MLVKFFNEVFAKGSFNGEIHFMAHSMGNMPITLFSPLFKELMLVAPDVSDRIFESENIS